MSGKDIFCHRNGVVILFTKNLKVDFDSKYLDFDGRILHCNIQINDTKVLLASVYAPTKNEPKIFDKFFFSFFQVFPNMIWFCLGTGI